MDVVRHKTPGVFLERAGEWLERAEAENNLILGISKYFEINPEQTKVNPYFLTVEDSGILLGAALMTPPRHRLLVSWRDLLPLEIIDTHVMRPLWTENSMIRPVRDAVDSIPTEIQTCDAPSLSG